MVLVSHSQAIEPTPAVCFRRKGKQIADRSGLLQLEYSVEKPLNREPPVDELVSRCDPEPQNAVYQLIGETSN